MKFILKITALLAFGFISQANAQEIKAEFKKEVKVEKGYYYRLRGYHSCTKNGVTENGGSSTNGIYIG